MLSAFPHWDARIGHGQRFGRDQWSAIVFLSKARALREDEQYHLQPLPVVVAGSSGTMSVHADILPLDIEKVVALVPTVFGSTGDEVVIKGGEVIPGSGGLSHARTRRREVTVGSG